MDQVVREASGVDGFLGSELSPEGLERRAGPPCAFARDGGAEGAIGRKQVVAGGGRRLVQDFMVHVGMLYRIG